MKKLIISAILTLAAANIAFAQTSRDMTFEVKGGPIFYGAIDEEASLGANKPFETIFGSKARFLFHSEYSYQFFQQYGSLAALLGVGVARFNGTALPSDGSKRVIEEKEEKESDGEEDEESSEIANMDKVSFWTVPISVGLSYRMDLFYRWYKVPLVPYVKLGGEYIFWWTTGPGAGVSKPEQGGSGRGGKYGIFLRPGLQLALNWIDPDAGKHFDTSVGINETYLFFEYSFDWVKSFKKEGFDLTHHTWLIGILFEF